MTYFHLVSEPNGFLSNWYPSEFALKDIVFTCIEQYDVKESYHFCDTEEALKIMQTSGSTGVKYLGWEVTGFIEFKWSTI